ncbi:hypothetical protein C8F04DRAFT_1253519 [Mycena alexandri]|uniref:Uncharacterized protein n=1 Tax=Mycena alexandri TaxID=1745969 RepID=A0AAD6X6N7_9AGAR|nr:hypothetical protein C8F04DRAFT_1253519 [Mycena alexandri]
MVSQHITVFFVLLSSVFAAPFNTSLETRAIKTCPDGNGPPCICNGALGIRSKALKCGAPSFRFIDPQSPTDGNLSLVPLILIYVESTANNAKGVAIGGRLFKGTTQKAANGAISYLKLLQANGAKNIDPGTHVATPIDTAMTTAMGAGKGFQPGFQTRSDTAVTNTIATFGYTSSGGPHSCYYNHPSTGRPLVIINETDSTIARCRRSGLWNAIQSFVVRAVANAPAATAAQCPVSIKKPAATPAAKPVAQPTPAKPVVKPVPVTTPA